MDLYPVALGGSLRKASPKKKKAPKSASKSDESAGPENPLSFAKADEALIALAKITGGHAYFPESPNDFVPIYSRSPQLCAINTCWVFAGSMTGSSFAYRAVLDGRGQPDAAAGKRSEYQVFCARRISRSSPLIV